MKGRSTVVHAAIHPSRTDLAWAAGFLEGEGCFAFEKSGSQTITAPQVKPWALFRLLRLFGGSITMKSGWQHFAAMPRWRVSGPRARGVMMTIYRFMSPHRQERIRAALRCERALFTRKAAA